MKKVKQNNREFVQGLVTADNTSILTNREGKILYKCLELVIGDEKPTFSDKMSEEDIIVIKLGDNDTMFNNAWSNYCMSTPRRDIGIIIINTDLTGSLKGADDNFHGIIKAATHLAMLQKDSIGECLIVINAKGTRIRDIYLKMDPLGKRNIWNDSQDLVRNPDFDWEEEQKITPKEAFRVMGEYYIQSSGEDSHRVRTATFSIDSIYEYKKGSVNWFTKGILI